MANPLEGSLAASIYGGFNKTLAYSLTLHSVTETEDADGSITQTEADSTVRGIVVEYENVFRMKAEGLLPDGARRCIVFQPSSSTAPKMLDRIVPLAGPFANETFSISEISQDPSGAIWDMMLVPWRPA